MIKSRIKKLIEESIYRRFKLLWKLGKKNVIYFERFDGKE